MGSRIVKLNLFKIVFYLIIIAILIDSETMYRHLTNSPLFGGGFGWAMGFTCLLYVCMSTTIKIDSKLSVRLPLLLIVLLVYIALSQYNVQRFLVGFVGIFFCMYFLSYFLHRKNQMQDFLKAFSNIMLFIACISLFFWLFGSILNILPGRITTTYYWADRIRTTYTYYYIYFENPTQNLVHNTICNLGIFVESPGYSGFLTYGLLVELLTRKSFSSKKELKLSTFKIAIYVVTLITTNSTKGVLAVMIALFIEYMFKDVKHSYNFVIKLVLGGVLLFIIAIAGTIIVENKLATSSGIVRMDDMLAGLRTFAQNPILGAGYENVDAIIRNQLVSRGNKGLSMGITTLMAYGGLWLSCFYIGAVILSFKNTHSTEQRKKWFLVCTVLVYNLFVSNSGLSDPYIFIVAAAYSAPTALKNK